MEFELSKLDIKDGDILLVRYNKRYNIKEVQESVYSVTKTIKNLPKAHFLIVGEGADIESLPEKEMNRHGWYKRPARTICRQCKGTGLDPMAEAGSNKVCQDCLGRKFIFKEY